MTEHNTTYTIERHAKHWILTEIGPDGSIWGVYEIPNEGMTLAIWLERIMDVTETE